MLNGLFNNLEMRNVVGYKISANWTPLVGFQGNFLVYIFEKSPAQERFRQAVNPGANGQPARGNLQLESASLHYQFKTIDLISAKIGATRQFRYRLLEFRYAAAVTNNGYTSITIINDETIRLAHGPLEGDYQYSLGDGAEHLFGYSTCLSSIGNSVVRFSTLRNNQNCFLGKMIRANDELNNGGGLAEFTVSFSQQDYRVSPQNLATWHIDESYGVFNHLELPALEDLAAGNLGLAALQRTVTLPPKDYTPQQLIEFDRRFDPIFNELSPHAVETATFVFSPGHYQNVRIT